MLTVLLVVGALGLVVVLAGLLLGELLDGAVDVVVPGDVGPGVTPAVGAAVSAFGFGGALALRTSDWALPVVLTLAVVGGLAVGALALVLSRAVVGDPAPPPTSTDLYGVFGSLVTRVPADGYGEVAVVVHGTRRKLAARSDGPLPAGTAVYVLEVLSETSVRVAPADPLALP